jgi:XTP/dITP diphosphohydrolase
MPLKMIRIVLFFIVMRKLMFATSNKGKVNEVRALLPDYVDILTPKNMPMTMPDETGTTFEENAIIKSEGVFEQCGIPTMAEDSGLVVDALSGRPGIYSSRYADDPVQAYLKVLDEMNGVTDRSARFVCALCFTWQGGQRLFVGSMEGSIGFEPVGENGFGYDPIFLFDGEHTTAQISKEEKNRISHRGEALAKFARWFVINESSII